MMNPSTPAVSVIISTYNSPTWLYKVLLGYSNQTTNDFEVVIADDGSDTRTEDVINEAKKNYSFPITHVWQKDEGFRKCRILNKAILCANADYLLFTDGDCIPRRDFVSTHLNEASPKHYLSGSYFKLPLDTSRTISEQNILSGECFQLKWLLDHGLSFFRKSYKIALPPTLAKICNRITTTRCNLKGSNASVWKADAIKVNGFDERMPWGGEDREFGVRLINSGIAPKHVRYNAIVIHLDHDRSYANQDIVKQNKQLRKYNEAHRITRTEFGLDKIDRSQIILK